MRDYNSIINSSMPYKKSCGIYFLIKDYEIIYVGKSTSVYNRIEAHNKDCNKDFDKWCYVLCDKDKLDDLEAEYIIEFKPKLNCTIPKNSKYLTISDMRGVWRRKFGKYYSDFVNTSKINSITPVYKDYYLIDDLLKLEEMSLIDNIIIDKIRQKDKMLVYNLYYIRCIEPKEICTITNLRRNVVIGFINILKSIENINKFSGDVKSILVWHFIHRKEIKDIAKCDNISIRHVQLTIIDYLRLFKVIPVKFLYNK